MEHVGNWIRPSSYLFNAKRKKTHIREHLPYVWLFRYGIFYTCKTRYIVNNHAVCSSHITARELVYCGGVEEKKEERVQKEAELACIAFWPAKLLTHLSCVEWNYTVPGTQGI